MIWSKEWLRRSLFRLTIGGGLTSLNKIHEILIRGADKVSINTAAAGDPNLVSRAADSFGSQCVVVAIDVKQVTPTCWEVYTHGGSRPTGLDAIEWAHRVTSLGAGEILLTSMDRDGRTHGFDLEITRRIASSINIPVIASGGGGTLQHFEDVFSRGQADAALAASIFHFKKFRIKDVKEFLLNKNIPVRV